MSQRHLDLTSTGEQKGPLTLGTKVAETFRRKTLFRITYPLSFFAALSVGVTFTDAAFLSNFADNLAAAVGMANQILGGAYDLSALMSVGALVLISQYLGNDQVSKACSIAMTGILPAPHWAA